MDELVRAASTAQASGDLNRVRALTRQILDIDPASIRAKLLLGVAEAKTGDASAAVDLLSKVRAGDSGSFQAPFWQSVALRKLGVSDEAAEAASAAVQLNPTDAQALTQLAICLTDLRRLSEAEELLLRAGELSGGAPPVLFQLSLVLSLQGRLDEAEGLLAKVLRGLPPSSENLQRLASNLMGQNNLLGASACARSAVELARGATSPKLLLARVLLEQNRAEEAEKLLQEVLARDSQDPEALTRSGTALQALGRLDEAIDCFQRAIAIAPRQAYPYFALVSGKRITDADRGLVGQMEEISRDRLVPKESSALRYGLGKAYADLGEFEASMHNYRLANETEAKLKYHGRAFDTAAYADRFDRVIQRFTFTELERMKQAGSESDQPVFVVGMMRSGTTLVEQILSRHPSIGAGGEQPFWLDNWPLALNGSQHSPEGMALLSERYLSLLKRLAPGKPRVVDKMPANYAGLGIIQAVFPEAKIVHIRRHPVDTCLSIYFTPNRTLTEFAHVPENIVFAYRQYLQVMEHWRSVLPQTNLFEVEYADLVSKPESTIRNMIDFLGLAWDDACLSPDQNRRSVVTPSVWQVRQPIYRSSLEVWKRYEPWLGSFRTLLPEDSEPKC